MSTSHPSALYQSIHRQPDIIRDVLRREADNARQAADLLAGARTVYLTGTGTSSHAAIVTEYLYRSFGLDAEARTAFDFANYGPKPHSGDVVVVISHRGAKTYGNRVLDIAKSAGARMIGVTGLDSPMAMPEVIFHTSPQEKSSTHTMSYTGNLTALWMAGFAYAEQSGGRPHPWRPLFEKMPEMIGEIVQRDHVLQPVAQAMAHSGRVVFAGAGPNVQTAREGALKVKESSYLTSEGFEIENLLHGGLQPQQPGDAAVVLAPPSTVPERAVDLVRALELLGAAILLVHDESRPFSAPVVEGDSGSISSFLLPPVPELLSPMLMVVPLQMLACRAAEIRGTDPDSFRSDDPRFKRINESYTL